VTTFVVARGGGDGTGCGYIEPATATVVSVDLVSFEKVQV